jgi:pyruvate dehydrogenase E2 component (dihydrolipoamide acetyltransferase)
MRKVIAQRMTESHNTMPPVTLNSVARMDAMIDLRRQLNEGAEAAGRRKFSFNDLLLSAAAKAVRACPWVNVSMDGNDIVQHQEINVGMAVALEQGLVVPVIHGADRLTLSEVADTARDLGRRAKERKLEVSDLEGGTFTVTNLGMYGITTFTPIINPPQAAILGVGAIRQELELGDDQSVRQRSVIDLSLTADHRLIDGAQGALFVKEIVALLENPAQILV